jgi:hypothetical protein
MAMRPWEKRTRFEKLSAVMYPAHADEATRREMAEIARGERKRPPAAQPLLHDHRRGSVSPLGGQAKRSK